ncbi:hypothetical protein Ddc_10550 [Ditylenchus destructor]|nr:hypothetical protein Ddc_10550 [Ditylenchus destructor]
MPSEPDPASDAAAEPRPCVRDLATKFESLSPRRAPGHNAKVTDTSDDILCGRPSTSQKIAQKAENKRSHRATIAIHIPIRATETMPIGTMPTGGMPMDSVPTGTMPIGAMPKTTANGEEPNPNEKFGSARGSATSAQPSSGSIWKRQNSLQRPKTKHSSHWNSIGLNIGIEAVVVGPIGLPSRVLENLHFAYGTILFPFYGNYWSIPAKTGRENRNNPQNPGTLQILSSRYLPGLTRQVCFWLPGDL